jgi:aromatic-L-amino-acid decarboxylase
MADRGDLSPDSFRRYGHEVVDWIADYLDGVGRLPVFPPVKPGEIRDALPGSPPAEPEPLDTILQDFRDVLLPGITHWNHPRFHAYFAITGSAPGILGEMLTAALNVNAMLWQTSPAATELETTVLDWLRQMLGLPEGFDGHINDTASVSTLVALAAAREAATDGAVREKGMSGQRLRLYTSAEAHSSVEKAALVLGLGHAGVRKIPVDDGLRMDPAALARAVTEDREAGWLPMAVSATVGTTGTNAVDPIPALADVCEREKIWLHVDAAYGGALALLPEFAWIMEGCGRADSVVMNPHKWLFVPIDCSALYTRRPQDVRRAFSLVPTYLMTPEDGRVKNLMDYGPSLGRRFRALKLWMVIRTFGVRGMAVRIRSHVELARNLASWIDAAPGWECLVPPPMATVLFRHVPSGDADDAAVNAHNREILDALNAGGYAFLSSTFVGKRLGLRLSVGNLKTTEDDLRETWRRLRAIADGI